MSPLEQATEIETLQNRVKELEWDISQRDKEINSLTDKIETLEDEKDGLERDIDDANERADDKEKELQCEFEGLVNQFLDEIERPVGKLTFVVPQTDRIDRAILGLFDAVRRTV